MRRLNIGTQRYTKVYCMDKPGKGNACHEYKIQTINNKGNPPIVLGNVSFQNGPIKETVVNGVMNEDLIAIVIDRLQGFQGGDFACKENARALRHLEKAMESLDSRTQGRISRGVEGTSII